MNVFWILVQVIEIAVFIYLGIAALYIFVFAVASLFLYLPSINQETKKRRFAVLIPGYKEDSVIVDVACQSLKQSYPSEQFEVIIIADSFLPETITELKKLPIRVIEVSFEKSTKSKALNKAMAEIGDQYDIALILDADNIMGENFIEKMNEAFDRGFLAVQGHRIAKNTNNNMAVLDAVSEEINNSIFRKGHRVAGLSSALIGSGMAFDYSFFKNLMSEIKAIGGFDKELELRLLRDRHKIEYVPDAVVYDEKVQKTEVFANQRKRWLSAQFVYFRRFVGPGLTDLVTKGNVDFFDKVYQMVQPPRVILLGVLTMWCFIVGFLNLVFPFWLWTHLALDFSPWFYIWLLTFFAFLFSIPRKFYNKKTLKALWGLPKGFFLMFVSLFKLKGANKRFIHTQHGTDES